MTVSDGHEELSQIDQKKLCRLAGTQSLWKVGEMARPQEVTNLHILGFLSDRVGDITKLHELLHVQTSDSIVGSNDSKKTLKRKLSMISTKKRTSSYMRYKLPRVRSKKNKKGKLSSPGSQCEPRCRRERRNRNLLKELHNIHALEANEFSLKDDQKVLPRWLETHFWNKKRFATKLCWGYCLPTHHKARGKRFVQSALKDHAVIHDSSYIRPIQVVGYSQNFYQLLRQITDPSTQSTQQNQPASSSSDSTCSEIPIILYKRNQFPSGCLGPASVCITSAAGELNSTAVQQADGTDDKLIQAWIWCHPALFPDALRELLEINADADAHQTCEICCVRGGIQRFSVRGEGSLALLEKVLQIEDKSGGLDGGLTQANVDVRCSVELSNEEFFRSVLKYQPFSRIWKENAALGLLVKDVRKLTNFYRDAQLHEREVQALSSTRGQDDRSSLNNTPVPGEKLKKKLVWPAASSSSPLWSAQQRTESSRKFIKDDELNKRMLKFKQSKCSQMQYRHDEEPFHNATSVNTTPKQDSSVLFPIIVIRKDLKNHSSKLMKNKKGLPFLGFDILLPSGWGAAVWRAFQFAGAIAVGIEELDSIQLDHGVASFPRDYPDTEAGKIFWQERTSSLEGEDLRKPPLKRVGASGLEVPRLDNLLWQGLSDDKNDSSSCAGRIEEEMNDAQADFNTGERKINIPESDAANNSNSSSDGNTDVVMVVDTGHIEGDQVPEQTVINSSTSRDDSNNAEGATDMAQVDEGYSQTFNVIREERYVRAFRVEFMSCSDDMDSREVDEAFLYSFMAKGDEKNMNDARKEDFYSRNWKLFYSLMECLARKPPLCLPFQSFLPVLLVPIGRGVCRDGTAIFIPSKDDYLEFVYYHEKRAEPSLSSSRQANKRLGEWRGIDSNIPRTRCGRKAKEKRSDIPAGGAISDLGSIPATREDRSSEICEERNLMGYVTSGRYSGSPCGSVSYGFCDATLYQEMAISAAQLLVEYKGTGIVGSRSPPRGRVLSLVMFRSPRSRWLRPALVDMISVLQ